MNPFRLASIGTLSIRMAKTMTVIGLAMFALAVSAFGQNETFRVMTYNGLKLDATDTDRQAAFETVFQSANADIILMQEIVDAGGADMLLAAMNAGGTQYARAAFTNGPDTDHMLFYRTSKVQFVSQNYIPTALRSFGEYVVIVNGNPVRLYSAHLKASQGSENEQKRFDEVSILRNHLNALPAGTDFIIGGAMNVYDSGEAAYQKFIVSCYQIMFL